MSKAIKIINTRDSEEIDDGDVLISTLDSTPTISSFAADSNRHFTEAKTNLVLNDKFSTITIPFNNLQSIELDKENIKTILLKNKDNQTQKFEDLFKKTTIDILLIGNQLIDNNKLWKNIVLGGSFKDENYQPIFDIDKTFHYENFSFEAPRTSIESQFLFGTVFKTVYSGKLEFNFYDADYFEDGSVANEWELPNLFLFLIDYKKNYEPLQKENTEGRLSKTATYDRAYGGGSIFRNRQKNFANKNMYKRGIINKRKTKNKKIKYRKIAEHKPSFRDFTSLKEGIEFNPLMIAKKITALKLLRDHKLVEKPSEISFNKNSSILIDSTYVDDDFDQIAKNCPFYNKIQVPLEGLGPIGKILNKHELLFKTMSDVKDVVLKQGLVDFSEEQSKFRKKYYNLILSPEDDSSSNSFKTYRDESLSSNQVFKVIDFSDLMAEEINCLDDPITNDSIQILDNVMERKLHSSNLFSNKYESNIRLNKAFAEIVDYVDKNELTFEEVIEGKKCHNEVLFYRLEKSSGQQLSDTREQQVLQNFYITNRDDAGVFVYYDSQLFPNKNYTYRLFEYRIVIGADYKYNNIFYSQKFSSEDGCSLMVNEEQPETPLVNSDNLFGNTFENARNRAEAQVTYQTSLKLHEIPTVVQDLPAALPPPAQPVIQFKTYPFIANTVFLSVDTEVGGYTQTYSPVTPDDFTYINNVFLAGNILDTEVPINSQIPIESIEVRILHSPPTGFDSFSTPDRIVSLPFSDDNGSFDKKTLQLVIDEGEEHYCTIRSINFVGNYSSPKQIFRLRINNEAGFRMLEVEEFNPFLLEEKSIAPFKEFNRLVRVKLSDGQRLSNVIVENLSQITGKEFVTNELNIRNESLVQKAFNKKFKLRLTSKTTGKKLDFNFTFKVKKEQK